MSNDSKFFVKMAIVGIGLLCLSLPTCIIHILEGHKVGYNLFWAVFDVVFILLNWFHISKELDKG